MFFGRRDVSSKYFSVPNWIFDRELDSVAIAIYIYLRFNEYRRYNAPLINIKKLSDELKVSEAVIEKRIRILLSRNMIDIEYG